MELQARLFFRLTAGNLFGQSATELERQQDMCDLQIGW